MKENHALISCDISCFTFHRIQHGIFLFSSIVCNVSSRFSKAIDELSKRIQQSFCSWTFFTMKDLLNASSKLKYFVRIIFILFSFLFFVALFTWRTRYDGEMKRHTERECKSITHANLSALLIGWSSWAASWTWICTFGSTKYFQQKIKSEKKEKRKNEKYGFVWYF